MSEQQPTKRTPEEVEKMQAFADGVFGAAGHRVDDPELREILRQQLAGEITGDEAREAFRKLRGL